MLVQQMQSMRLLRAATGAREFGWAMLVPAPVLPGLRSPPSRLGVTARAMDYGAALPSKAGDGACQPPFLPRRAGHQLSTRLCCWRPFLIDPSGPLALPATPARPTCNTTTHPPRPSDYRVTPREGLGAFLGPPRVSSRSDLGRGV